MEEETQGKEDAKGLGRCKWKMEKGTWAGYLAFRKESKEEIKERR